MGDERIQESNRLVERVSAEIEQLTAAVTKQQETTLTVQKSRLKEVSTLKNQREMLGDELQQNMKKLKDNSDVTALHSLFKRIKGSFDELKSLLAEINEAAVTKQKMHELHQQLADKASKSAQA